MLIDNVISQKIHNQLFFINVIYFDIMNNLDYFVHIVYNN